MKTQIIYETQYFTKNTHPNTIICQSKENCLKITVWMTEESLQVKRFKSIPFYVSSANFPTCNFEAALSSQMLKTCNKRENEFLSNFFKSNFFQQTMACCFWHLLVDFNGKQKYPWCILTCRLQWWLRRLHTYLQTVMMVTNVFLVYTYLQTVMMIANVFLVNT